MADYGVFSTRWLLSQALKHVPREDLNNAVASMLYFMQKSEAPTVPRCWDVLGQVAFTGQYVPPEVYLDAQQPSEPETPEEKIDYRDEGNNPRNPGTEITEEEIEQAKKWMDNVLDDAEDPHEGFKL